MTEVRIQHPVSAIMFKDHLRLLSQLNDFEQATPEYRLNAFRIFTENLSKHFNIEENSIFSSFDLHSQDNEDYQIYEQIVTHHNQILTLIDELQKKLLVEQGFDTVEIRDRLQNHVHYEESVVYPRMDAYLTQEEKNDILAEISTLF